MERMTDDEMWTKISLLKRAADLNDFKQGQKLKYKWELGYNILVRLMEIDSRMLDRCVYYKDGKIETCDIMLFGIPVEENQSFEVETIKLWQEVSE